MSDLYLLPKNNTDSWNLNSKDLNLNLTTGGLFNANLSSTGTYNVKINNVSKLTINPTNGIIFNTSYYVVGATEGSGGNKIFVQSTDPSLVPGAVSAGDIWFNTTPPA